MGVVDGPLRFDEVPIVFTGVGVVGACKGVTTRLRPDLADRCREYIGPVEVVAAPSMAARPGSLFGVAPPTCCGMSWIVTSISSA